MIDGHRQSAAVETGFGRASSPEIWNTDKAPGGPYQFIAQVSLAACIPLCGGVFLGCDNIELFDNTPCPEILGPLPGLFPAWKIAKTDLIQTLSGNKIGGIETFLLKGPGEMCGIFHPRKRPGLDAISEPGKRLHSHKRHRRGGRLDIGMNGQTAAPPDHKDQENSAQQQRPPAALPLHPVFPHHRRPYDVIFAGHFQQSLQKKQALSPGSA